MLFAIIASALQNQLIALKCPYQDASEVKRQNRTKNPHHRTKDLPKGENRSKLNKWLFSFSLD